MERSGAGGGDREVSRNLKEFGALLQISLAAVKIKPKLVILILILILSYVTLLMHTYCTPFSLVLPPPNSSPHHIPNSLPKFPLSTSKHFILTNL
jgi:hypothetical protein